MTSRLLAALLLSLLVVPLAWAQEKPPAAEASGPPGNPWSDDQLALSLLQFYLDQMKLEYTADSSAESPSIAIGFEGANTQHDMRILVDGRRQMVYVFLNRYLTIKPDSPNLSATLRTLMEQNWKLNIGKFEWDPADGEVRFSYCFTTENGIGFEAFQAIIVTLVQTGDTLWPELSALAGGAADGAVG